MADLDDDPFNVANDFLDRHSPPGKEERNATLRELIAEISQPLWRAAANARLDELEAAQSATGTRYQRVFEAVMALTDAEDQLACILPGPERDELQEAINEVNHD